VRLLVQFDHHLSTAGRPPQLSRLGTGLARGAMRGQSATGREPLRPEPQHFLAKSGPELTKTGHIRGSKKETPQFRLRGRRDSAGVRLLPVRARIYIKLRRRLQGVSYEERELVEPMARVPYHY
jgi:hypothetical protein